jgi:hypothetical protein
MTYTKPVHATDGYSMYLSQPKVDNMHFATLNRSQASSEDACHVLPDAQRCAELKLSWRTLLHCTECSQTWYIDVNALNYVVWKQVRWWNFSMSRKAKELALKSRGLKRRGR